MKNVLKSLRSLVVVLAGAPLFVVGLALALAQETPDVTIRRAVDGVTSTLNTDKAILTGDRRRINLLVDEKVMPYVSIGRMTQSALGPAWARATPEQRQALTAEFKRLLTNTYAVAFAGYQPDTKIEYRPLRLATGDNDATVRSLVSAGGAEPIQLDYYLEQIDGAWKVTDFGVFGVRLVETYKGQFRGAVASSGVDGLIKALEAKNISNEARTVQ